MLAVLQPLVEPWRPLWTHSLPTLATLIRLMNSPWRAHGRCLNAFSCRGHPICFIFDDKVSPPQGGESVSMVTMGRFGVVLRDRRNPPVVRGE